ncbi:MAG: SulP family inorganic anion transporter, partial [Acidimicrobiia bacterium]
PTAAAALAVAVGAVSLVAWVARLGFLASLLSKPVLVGYLAGVAVSMTVSQLPNLTGIPSRHDATLPELAHVATGLDELEAAPLLLGLAVVAALYALRPFRRVPGTLLVILAATVVTAALDLEAHGVATLGTVPTGLPAPSLPDVPVHLWPAVLGAAVGVAFVAFSGNVLTSRAFAPPGGRDDLDADQELLALSASNVAAGLAGGLPVSSSDSRTALVVASGGRSHLAGLVAAACLAVVLVVAAPVLEAFPLAALGGLVVYAAAQLLDVGELRRVVAFRTSEAVIMVAAAGGVVAFGLLIGVGIAVGLSVGDLLRRVARGHDAVQGIVPGLAGMHDVDDYPEATTIPGLVVFRYDAPLFFANADDFRTRALRAVDTAPDPVEWLVLNVEANVETDITATDMLLGLHDELAARGVVLALARVKQDLAVYLDRVGLLDRIGSALVFPTLPTAVEGFRARPPR